MVITLLSDFGDVYPASMKGVILGINPEAQIVDISHSIPRHDINAGAFVLMAAARYFPSQTVHIAVVDPGVGTERRTIAVKAGAEERTHYFIGPDNGLLIPAAKSIGELEVYEIANRRLFLPGVSPAFHGRDIFAPIGARISKGLDIKEVGRQIFDFVSLDFGEGSKEGDSLKGGVIFIDSFGNIVTNIHSKIAGFKHGDVVEIQRKRIPFYDSYGFCKKGEPLALIGSHGFLEIAVNQGNASLFFDKKQGDEITVRKIT